MRPERNKRGRLTERQVSRREKQADRPGNRPAGRKTDRQATIRQRQKTGRCGPTAASPLLRDSGAVRTLDPQLRRLLLYPTELRNHRRAGPESPVCGCKGRKNFSFSSPFRRFMDENLPFFSELFCRAEFFVYICRLESPKRVSVLLTFFTKFYSKWLLKFVWHVTARRVLPSTTSLPQIAERRETVNSSKSWAPTTPTRILLRST